MCTSSAQTNVTLNSRMFFIKTFRFLLCIYLIVLLWWLCLVILNRWTLGLFHVIFIYLPRVLINLLMADFTLLMVNPIRSNVFTCSLFRNELSPKIKHIDFKMTSYCGGFVYNWSLTITFKFPLQVQNHEKKHWWRDGHMTNLYLWADGKKTANQMTCIIQIWIILQWNCPCLSCLTK